MRIHLDQLLGVHGHHCAAFARTRRLQLAQRARVHGAWCVVRVGSSGGKLKAALGELGQDASGNKQMMQGRGIRADLALLERSD
eukprot:COSAG01_NODE_8226_length_2867_cov_2.022760_2_plen_84_part_00